MCEIVMSTDLNLARGEITHVIFDLDGLLLDTECLYTQVTQSILSRFGLTFEWSLKARMMGRRPLDGAKILVDALDLPMSPEEFHRELYSTLTEMFPEARFLPGAEKLMKHLMDEGIPVAIATGSSLSSYKQKISKHELFSGISHAVCSDDPHVKDGKPAPFIYQVAASRFKDPPSCNAKVLVFEDAPNGVEAGKAAGMKVVMVPDKRTDPDKFVKADCVLNSLEDLKLEEWGLPNFRKL